MSRIGPTRGRSISSRSRSDASPSASPRSRCSSSKDVSAPSWKPKRRRSAHAHPVGGRRAVERPRDRRPPVDDHRVARARRGRAAGRCGRPRLARRVRVAVGAAEERRRVRVGGQRLEPLGAQPAEALAGEFVDAVVGDAVGGRPASRAGSGGPGRGGVVRGSVRHRAPRSNDVTRRRQPNYPIRVASAAWSRDTPPKHDSTPPTPEHARLAESPDSTSPWRLWGPYLSGRQWGTVREDYSADGDAWTYLPVRAGPPPGLPLGRGRPRRLLRSIRIPELLGRAVERARPDAEGAAVRADQRRGQPRRGRQGVLVGAGRHAHALVGAVAATAIRRPSSRTSSCAARTPRADATTASTNWPTPASSTTTGSSTSTVTYAKAAPDDVLMAVEATNHGPDPAPLHLLPQVWFRNTWAWGRDDRTPAAAPHRPARAPRRRPARGRVRARLPRPLHADRRRARPTSSCATTRRTPRRCSASTANPTPYTKDGIDARVVHGDESAVNPDGAGTKAAFWYRFDAVAPGETVRVRLRLSRAARASTRSARASTRSAPTGAREADDFYRAVLPERLTPRTRDRPARVRRAAVEQAALPLHRRRMARGRPGRSRRRRRRVRSRGARNVAVAAPRPGRRDLHARRLGVPVVRRVGPRVPLRRARARRSRRSPRSSCCSCAASGRCTRTVNCPPTSGRSATSTRRCTHGRRGGCT